MNKRTHDHAANAVALLTFLLPVIHANAQPSNPGPEGTGQQIAFDFGDVGIGFNATSPNIPIAAGDHVWFRFRLTDAISPLANWLDIDTAGPSGISNNEVAIYDAWANKLGEDNDNGGSGNSNGNGWAAAMSFGGGSGQRLSGDAPGWGGGRISDGAWGWTLAAGTYYVVITGFDASFPDPNPTWIAPTNSTAIGTVRLRVSTGPVPPTYWNERHHGGGAGEVPENAQVIEGSGSLNTIVTRFSAGQRDLFKIYICDPASFSATATLTHGEPCCGGGTLRGRLFLFNAHGQGVAAINNTLANTTTTLVPPQPPAPGEYFLAVSSYCAGFWGEAPGDGGPLDANNIPIWSFAGHNNVGIAPSIFSPLSHWARQIACEGVDQSNEQYYVNIALAGVCYVPAQAFCPVDFDGSGTQDLFDFAEFQNCFEGP